MEHKVRHMNVDQVWQATACTQREYFHFVAKEYISDTEKITIFSMSNFEEGNKSKDYKRLILFVCLFF